MSWGRMELFASKCHLEDEQGMGGACRGGSVTVTYQLPPARPQQVLRKCSHWTVRAGGTSEALETKLLLSQERLGPAGAGVPAWLPLSPAPADALPGRDPATSAYSDPTHPHLLQGPGLPLLSPGTPATTTAPASSWEDISSRPSARP